MRLPYPYNQLVVKRAAVFVFVVCLLLCASLLAQDSTTSARSTVGRIVVGHTMVVIPFENASPTPGLEWLGESFPETFHEQLDSPDRKSTRLNSSHLVSRMPSSA